MPLTLPELIAVCHQTAKDKGWWENPDRNFGELIALAHSELSEALEEYRKHGLNRLYYENHDEFVIGPDGKKLFKPEGIASEFADVLIRLFDNCARYNIPLVEAMDKKMRFNASRPYRHGGKLA
jgi:NTP pyrophosphatase (non-canonical NTP hydrolase)